MTGCIVCKDGTCFQGTRFGSRVPVVGEIAIYTGVVGWQEVLTDPAYAGKIVVFTYPHVGNYGVNEEDVESSDVTVKGIVVRDLARFYSNFRAKGDFRSWVEAKGIAGLTGVDTRAVMVHTRDHGDGIAAIAANDVEAQKVLRESGSPFDRNLVSEVQGLCLPMAMGKRECGETGNRHQHSALSAQDPLVPLAVLDLGGKYSLYRQFTELGCSLQIFPWDTSAEAILASGATGLLLPPGPGDPNKLMAVANQVGQLLGRLPTLGIGLGFQLLALALGGRVTRLKAGRHGVNYPVCSTRGEPSLIAACHHSFAVDASSLPAGIDVTYFHLNEGTPLGIEAIGLRSWGYQFHPSRDGDDRPSPLLARFIESCLGSQESKGGSRAQAPEASPEGGSRAQAPEASPEGGSRAQAPEASPEGGSRAQAPEASPKGGSRAHTGVWGCPPAILAGFGVSPNTSPPHTPTLMEDADHA